MRIPPGRTSCRDWRRMDIGMSRAPSGIFLLASGLIVSAMLCGQSRKADDLAAGKVLVMQRDAPDPLFAESVILLIHYDTDGVVGLMLNQKSNIPLSEIREISGTKKRFEPAYAGGPVEVEAITGLIRAA